MLEVIHGTQPDVRLLGEPTHLDIPTREQIEAALRHFAGTLLLVSHDRSLLDRLTDETIILTNNVLLMNNVLMSNVLMNNVAAIYPTSIREVLPGRWSGMPGASWDAWDRLRLRSHVWHESCYTFPAIRCFYAKGAKAPSLADA